MGAPAKKLDLSPAEPDFPPLEKGEYLMAGMNFPAQGAWGNRHLHLGKKYAFGFEIDGTVERLVALPSGVCRAFVRKAADRGVGKIVTFLFFPTGAFGPEAE